MPVRGTQGPQPIAARTPSSRKVGGIRTSSTARSGCEVFDLGEQRVGVAVGADDLVTGLDEHAHEAFAEQDRIVGDDHAEEVSRPQASGAKPRAAEVSDR